MHLYFISDFETFRGKNLEDDQWRVKAVKVLESRVIITLLRLRLRRRRTPAAAPIYCYFFYPFVFSESNNHLNRWAVAAVPVDRVLVWEEALM